MRTLLLFVLLSIGIFAKGIEEYRPISGCATLNAIEYKLLRSFHYQNGSYYLALNPNTLQTLILDANSTKMGQCSQNFFISRYAKLLEQSSAPPFPLQNDGITHASAGFYLTVDLCPSSHKGYEERLFRALIEQPNHPVPVTLFITKRWILKHFNAFNQLKEWQKRGLLDITWGNHTAYHHYNKKRPLQHNFVLLPGENLQKDILDLEQTLLNYGVVPSIFFRFPGLVSDKKSVETVKHLGLIIIGSNSWLAKGELPKKGSIILIHGNKNEPKGVDIFLKLLFRGFLKSLQPLKRLK